MTPHTRSSFVPLLDTLTRPRPLSETFVSIEEMLAEAQTLKAENRRLKAKLGADASHWARCSCCQGDYHSQMQASTCPHRLINEQARTLTVIEGNVVPLFPKA